MIWLHTDLSSYFGEYNIINSINSKFPKIRSKLTYLDFTINNKSKLGKYSVIHCTELKIYTEGHRDRSACCSSILLVVEKCVTCLRLLVI